MIDDPFAWGMYSMLCLILSNQLRGWLGVPMLLAGTVCFAIAFKMLMGL